MQGKVGTSASLSKNPEGKVGLVVCLIFVSPTPVLFRPHIHLWTTGPPERPGREQLSAPPTSGRRGVRTLAVG